MALAGLLTRGWWALTEAGTQVASSWSALTTTLERVLPPWLFATLQTAFVFAATIVLFVATICLAWVLLWKLVLSKIRFVVALKNELLLGQPSRPAPSSKRRQHAHSD